MPFSENIKAYLVVTLSYWSLMLTDGALRMLTLLMLNARGFTPIQLCLLLCPLLQFAQNPHLGKNQRQWYRLAG